MTPPCLLIDGVMLGHITSSVEENGLFFVRSGSNNTPPSFCASLRAVRNGLAKAPPVSCKLVPAVPSPPPCHLYRNNRPRSQPPHFASTALTSSAPPPSSEMRRRVPLSPLFILSVTREMSTLMNVPSNVPVPSSHWMVSIFWSTGRS